MEVFRIANKKYIKDLQGTGAKLFGGRWNPKGIPMLYTAAYRSLAALEFLVHMDLDLIPDELKIITLEIPDVSIIKFGEAKFNSLNKKVNASLLMKSAGVKWIQSEKSLALEVPSVLIKEESNILINPFHKDFSTLKIKSTKDFNFDVRLIK